MQKDLQEAYIPACIDCQHNKGRTSSLPGPLHPLPVLDNCGDSITIDFIGPCLKDEGFNAIITITDHLGAGICIASMHMDITTEWFAAQFFDLWYC